jgi:FixJ family two-component response regulator
MTDGRKQLIAIIDDDDSVSDPIRMLLELHGWEAKPYRSCEDFLNDLNMDNPPACLILDLHFPGMNGVELQQSLSNKNIAIPTIVLTARPDGPLAPLSLKAGALEVVTKPIKGHQLVQKIKAVINVENSSLPERE